MSEIIDYCPKCLRDRNEKTPLSLEHWTDYDLENNILKCTNPKCDYKLIIPKGKSS